MRIISIIAVTTTASIFLSGCVIQDRVAFNVKADQNAIVRDGRPAIVSKKKNSIVLVSPASREINNGERPIYIVAATNLTKTPIDLHVSNINVFQRMANGEKSRLPIFTYEDLVQEERTRQVMAAILVGAASAANSYSAAQAGYGHANSTIYTPHGAAYVNTSYYSPAAAAIASSNAAAQNDAMITGTIETGRQNLNALEKSVLKDNTIMPGEWVGGQLQFIPPQGDLGSEKKYTIVISMDNETHEIDVTQTPIQQQ